MLPCFFFSLMMNTGSLAALELPSDLKTAQEMAMQSGKDILIYWKNDWCQGSIEFTAYLEKSELRDWLNQVAVFIGIHTGKGDGAALAKTLKINGWPHFMILDGKSLAIKDRFYGFSDEATFRKDLRQRLKGPGIASIAENFEKQPTEAGAFRLATYWEISSEYASASEYYRRAMSLSKTPHQYWQKHFICFFQGFANGQITAETLEAKLLAARSEVRTPMEAFAVYTDAYFYVKDFDERNQAWLHQFQPLLDQISFEDFEPGESGLAKKRNFAIFNAEYMAGDPDAAYAYLQKHAPPRDVYDERMYVMFLNEYRILPEKELFHREQAFAKCDSPWCRVYTCMGLAEFHIARKQYKQAARWVNEAKPEAWRESSLEKLEKLSAQIEKGLQGKGD